MYSLIRVFYNSAETQLETELKTKIVSARLKAQYEQDN